MAEPRRSLSGQISAFGSKIGRALTNDSENGASAEGSIDKARSVSRGREYQSSGRGGLGNIRPSSQDPVVISGPGPDDFSPTRGREGQVDPTKIHSTGRGGAGNIRSPSRDAKPVGPTDYEKGVIKDHTAADQTVHVSGRGGYGNISGSRSRSRDPSGALHSTGKGGTGNMAPGDGARAASIDAKERASYSHPEGMHSTGRGGAANLTTASAGIEHHPHEEHGYASSGRGGAGNIRDRSSSREPPKKSGLGTVLHKATHPHDHHHEEPAQPTVPEEY